MTSQNDREKYESTYNRMSRKLANETSELSGKFMQRLEGIRGNLSVLNAVKGLDRDLALKTAVSYLGIGEYLAAGIDGSMDYDERLETLFFYVNATAYSAPFIVSENEVRVRVNEIKRSESLSSYAAVPLWLEDLSEVFMNREAAETEYDFHTSIEKIPFALMTMAELWSALNTARMKGVRLIFLDRSLYGTYTSALKDMRVILRSGYSLLTKVSTELGQPSMLDISLASVLGAWSEIPNRAPYQVYSAIKMLIDGMDSSSIAERLGLKGKEAERLFRKIQIKNEESGGSLLETGEDLRVKESVKGYWERAVAVAEHIAKKAFESDEHPLKVNDKDWLTIYDINAVNVFLLLELVRESVENGILLVGITKDTAASDFTRSVLPFSRSLKIIGKDAPVSFRNDKGFLTVMAAVNGEKMKTPWRAMSYDSSFTSMNGNPESTPVLSAARKYISRERLFVKSYFQLRAFATDPQMRSPVFAYDRPFMELLDLNFIERTSAVSRSGSVDLDVYFEGSKMNEIDNLVLYILSLSDNPQVLEAYGHNQLLYMADKYVKYEMMKTKGALRGVAELQLGALARRERIFSISRRFRDMRSESEKLREKGAKEAAE